jgi:hypothetical protein
MTENNKCDICLCVECKLFDVCTAVNHDTKYYCEHTCKSFGAIISCTKDNEKLGGF